MCKSFLFLFIIPPVGLKRNRSLPLLKIFASFLPGGEEAAQRARILWRAPLRQAKAAAGALAARAQRRHLAVGEGCGGLRVEHWEVFRMAPSHPVP